ncbi:hypothetical protein ACSSS7_004380 [Eimeria intestinalis]
MPKTIAYEWSQTATHLSLLLRMPHLKPKPAQRQPEEQLSVVLTSCFLRVCRHPFLLELDLWGDVAFTAATILPSKDSFSIVVPKSKEGFWGAVAAVSNPQLQPADIKERRELALAAYAEWQQQLHEKRVAERQARQDQQQKLVWDQQRQQREWQQQQKDLQVQQVLKQLEDDDEQSPRAANHGAAAKHDVAAETAADAEAKQLPAEVGQLPEHKDEKIVFIGDSSDAESEKNSSTLTRKEPGSPCPPREAPDDSLLHIEVENRSCSSNQKQAEEGLQSKPAEEAVAELLPVQQSYDGATVIAQKDINATLVTVRDTAFSATECKTIKLSFGARRPNRVPARGPRAPPLPQAAAAPSRSSNHLRDRPGDLARLRQSSPQWLQSKALRLLSGGDPAAAADAYTASLEALPQPPHQLSVAKILCGRSLAWLANGDNQKALSDCSEALGVLQEVQMQEDAAAAAAGSSRRAEILRKPQKGVAFGPSAAFLRWRQLLRACGMSAGHRAAESLEELQQLQQQHLQLQLQEDGPQISQCDASDSAAVTADLQNVRRLLHARPVKDEADAALRVGLKRSQEQQKQLSLPCDANEQEEAQEGETPQTAAQTKPLIAASLLHRSISLYVRLVQNHLLPISPSKSVQQEDLNSAADSSSTMNYCPATKAESLQKSQAPDGTSPRASSCGNDFTGFKSDEATEDAIAGAREIAAKVTAAARAAAGGMEPFSCAAAAAAVLSNMALALLQLHELSACSAAQAVASAANALVELVEKKHKIQQVGTDSQLGQHLRESAADSALVEEKRATAVEKEQPSLAGTVSVLHKATRQ